MRTAVVRVNVDPAASLTARQLTDGAETLASQGFELIPVRLDSAPTHRREIQLVLGGDDVEALRRTAVDACRSAFGVDPVAGVVTFVSRGTDEDALGVVAAFGAKAELTRIVEDGEEIAVFELSRDDLSGVPESRLQTALEAALNCEVRIVVG